MYHLFYKEQELNKNNLNKETSILKFQGGNRIVQVNNYFYVIKGSKILEYLYESKSMHLIREIPLMTGIDEYIVNDNFIIIKTFGSTLGIYETRKEKFVCKKSWRNTKIEKLCRISSSEILVIINKVICKVEMETLNSTEICDLKVELNSNNILIKSLFYIEQNSECICHCLYYPLEKADSSMSGCCIRINLQNQSVNKQLLDKEFRTPNEPQYYRELSILSFIQNDKLYICNTQHKIISELILPYYKVSIDGGGMFPKEEFMEYALWVKVSCDKRELLIAYRHGVVLFDLKCYKIRYQKWVNSDLINDTVYLENGTFLYTVGQRMYLVIL